MSNFSVDCTINRKDSDETRLKLPKIYEKMQENLNRVQKYVTLLKEVLSDCCEKLEELRYQMADLKSMMEETNAYDKRQSADTNNEIKGRNLPRENPIQGICENVTIKESGRSAESSKSFESKNDGNQRKKFKSNPENEEIAHSQEANTECMPGTSKIISSIRNNNPSQSQQDVVLNDSETRETTGTPFIEDVVKTALLNTEGILSAQELNSFLYLSAEVDDPVNLAKLAFTEDIKALYFQLLNFHFVLNVANDDVEKKGYASNSHRKLEVQVQNLISAFKTTIENSDSQRQASSGLFRQGVGTSQ